ncbi:MAG: ABC transporter ATP-binding protein, partial [Armatimonadetes bacterium]|nr:ABC transporter ATP-binding protein [Armatimonadota bacterium]
EIVSGRLFFDGEDLLDKPERAMRDIRGGRIAMVFQDPLSTLNPTFTVESQIRETLEIHGIARGKQARARSLELLEAMGIPAPVERLRNYPHELSGGLRQRVMIAIAVSCEPDLLIADEPTTALDVTLQAQIMDLLKRVKEERGLATILITHDLGIVSQFAESAAVMYAGQIVEQATVASLLADPLHPYTKGLLRCVPRLGRPDLPITPIEGTVPDLVAPPPGCRFAPRCPEVMERCSQAVPPMYEPEAGRRVRCYLYDEKPRARSAGREDSTEASQGGSVQRSP